MRRRSSKKPTSARQIRRDNRDRGYKGYKGGRGRSSCSLEKSERRHTSPFRDEAALRVCSSEPAVASAQRIVGFPFGGSGLGLACQPYRDFVPAAPSPR
jgi:hypothetical protein